MMNPATAAPTVQVHGDAYNPLDKGGLGFGNLRSDLGEPRVDLRKPSLHLSLKFGSKVFEVGLCRNGLGKGLAEGVGRASRLRSVKLAAFRRST